MVLLFAPDTLLHACEAVDDDGGGTAASIDGQPVGIAVDNGVLTFVATGATMELKRLRKAARDGKRLYMLDGDAFGKISFHSPETNNVYALRPSASWPALEISGILMHRVKETDPRHDAERKLEAVAPVAGAVLDTCCGLGYTATLASRTASSVTTCEKDPNVVRLARVNPYSRGLFEGKNVRLIEGSIADEIGGFRAGAFDIVLHDPPAIAIAGELYSGEFYDRLRRVMRRGGKLLHYTGAPGSRYRNRDVPGGVAARLREAGFKAPRYIAEVFCVLCSA